MTKDTTPTRSIRLTKAHREDMLNAVIKEWESQNPCPVADDDLSLIAVIAPLIKKTAAYKRTQRMIAAELQYDDWKHVSSESKTKVAIIDSEGATRDTLLVQIPVSIAEAHGLIGMPNPRVDGTNDYSPSQLTRDDIEGEKPDDMTSTTKRPLTLKMFTLAEQYYPTIQVERDCPAMLARKASRQKRNQWENERSRLRRETSDLLDQFNTTKQLREGWPDIVPYLPPHLADPERAVKLPVLATSRLSERLGIKGESDNG